MRISTSCGSSGRQLLVNASPSATCEDLYVAVAQRQNLNSNSFRLVNPVGGCTLLRHQLVSELGREQNGELELDYFFTQHGGAGGSDGEEEEDEAEEKKPVKEVSKCLLKVKYPEGETIEFRIKFTTPFTKVYNAVAEQRGIAAGSFTLSWDGKRLNREENPKMLEFESEESVDFMATQIGGCL